MKPTEEQLIAAAERVMREGKPLPKPTDVSCPRCNAPPGTPCEKKGGHEFAHIERWRDANLPDRPFR